MLCISDRSSHSSKRSYKHQKKTVNPRTTQFDLHFKSWIQLLVWSLHSAHSWLSVKAVTWSLFMLPTGRIYMTIKLFITWHLFRVTLVPQTDGPQNRFIQLQKDETEVIGEDSRTKLLKMESIWITSDFSFTPTSRFQTLDHKDVPSLEESHDLEKLPLWFDKTTEMEDFLCVSDLTGSPVRCEMSRFYWTSCPVGYFSRR